MERVKKILANATFAILVLLSFLLIFEQQLELPAWLQAFGRMHPLLLHLPIGLLFIVALLVFTRRHFESPTFDPLLSFLLYMAVFTASLTALMGLFLSQEGGYDEHDLVLHKWLGIVTCYGGAILLIVQTKRTIFNITLMVSVVVLTITGHYGAALTHGEGFVLGPLKQQNEAVQLSETSSVFEAAIGPLFERKCAGCHNETKAKGRLILTSPEHVLTGGKSGKLWEKNDANSSLLMKRLLLPINDKKHMPPKDKPQLTTDELKFVSMWIAQGADTKRTLNEYSETDSLRLLSARMISAAKNTVQQPRYHFDFADPEKVESLNNPYRTLLPVAQNEPALQANFFVRQAFDKKSLQELSAVKEQLVSISLSKMPVTDEDLSLLVPFINLEVLNLNNTDITGKNLFQLKSLEKLHSLSLSGTPVTSDVVDGLADLKNLKKVFIWNTRITPPQADELRSKYPAILWESGYVPDAKEVLQLSTPLMVSEQVLKPVESIVLKATLPGTVIRYTLDGSTPDSVTGLVYEKPLVPKPYQVIKARGIKSGWRSSNVAEFVTFRSGYKPSRAELRTKAHERYPGEGAQTLINGKKGAPDFFRDPTWIAFREGPLEALFYFDDPPEIQSLTISYSKNVGAMTMPPVEVEVWGGADEQHMTLLKKIKPVQPIEYGISRIEGVEVTFPKTRARCYKLIAKPLSKLPAFRESKEKGWLMMDEVFFN
jgi:Planctomycete cytochrome C/Fn3 associated